MFMKETPAFVKYIFDQIDGCLLAVYGNEKTKAAPQIPSRP